MIRAFSISFSAWLIASTAFAAQPQLHKLLTSVKKNVHVDEWTHKGTDTATGKAWTIEKRTLHGGKQEGVDVIHVSNGTLTFVVSPTRGMNVYEVRSGDIRLGWNSPVKELVHPSLINLQSRGGLGWLDGFDEWMVRCGLESAGHPGTDKFVNNVGDEATMDLTLHGKIGNIPASEVEVLVDDRIRVRGRVDEPMFYGPKLEIWTEISTEFGSREFRITDKLSNRGDEPQEFQLIYHANFGPPILEKGAKLVAPIKELVPFNDHAAQSIDGFATYQAPTAGFVEQVYCIYPHADKDRRTQIMLHNAAGDKGVAMSWSLDELPCLTQWKNALTEKDGYVTGLEPGTGFPYNRRVERKHGRVPKLDPGQTRTFSIDFGILRDSTDVRNTAKRVAALAKDRPPKVRTQPFDTE